MSFSLALILCMFNWSILYPVIKSDVIIFLFITFIVSLFLGVLYSKTFEPKFINLSNQRRPRISMYLLSVLAPFSILIATDRDLPLYMVLVHGTSNHNEYGISLLMPLVLTLCTLFAAYFFQLFLSFKDKKYLLMYFTLYIPPLLLFSRGTLTIIFMVTIFILLMFFGRKIKIKHLLATGTLILLAMYLFGSSGDTRISGGETTILGMGGATDNFLQSSVPDEYFWSYIYISSPLANFQLNVDSQDYLNNNIPFHTFILAEIVPGFISKYILEIYDMTEAQPALIAPPFTVGTMYSKAFSYSNWLGPTIIFSYFIILIFSFMKVVSKKNPFFVSGIAILCAMSFLNTFSNMLMHSSIILPMFYIILFGFLIRIPFIRNFYYHKELGI